VGAKTRRVEVRFPDPASNMYLAFAAMLMAGLDGIERKISPGDPLDKNLYDLPPEELKDVPTVCSGLRMALDTLDVDREFLKKGNVFSDDVINAYIELKLEELDRFETFPHPVEFDMYYKC
jgi:glutamine synthetase